MICSLSKTPKIMLQYVSIFEILKNELAKIIVPKKIFYE